MATPQLNQDEMAQLENDMEDVNCKACIHYPICNIYHNFSNMLQGLTAHIPDTENPVIPEDLAKICEFFNPVISTP